MGSNGNEDVIRYPRLPEGKRGPTTRRSGGR